MKHKAKKGEFVLAGYIGHIESPREGIVSISLANRVSSEITEWVSVIFKDIKKDGKIIFNGVKVASYLSVGQYVAIVAEEQKKTINNDSIKTYFNYYAKKIAFGPSK